jgi:putative PEP-CTERM system TPR-repeat lipoprotein
MASFYLAEGKRGEAQALIDQILEKDKANMPARFLKARLLFDKNQMSNAKDILQGIAGEHQNHSGAYYHLGLIYLAEKNEKDAKAVLLKAIGYDPDNINARILLAQIFLNERQADRAIEQLGAVIARQPEHFQAYMLAASAYLQKNDPGKARQALLSAAKIRPDEPVSYLQLARLEQHDGHYDNAISYVDKVLALKGDHVAALDSKVSIFLAQKQTEKALLFLDEQIGKNDSNPGLKAVLHELKGRAFESTKDYKQSEISYKKALELNPDMLGPYLSLAGIYIAAGKSDEAIAQYKEILEKQPEFIQAYLALAALYEAKGGLEEAKKMCEKALTINPDFAPAANNLAWLLLQQGQDPDNALALAKRAKSLLPDDPRIIDTLGLALITKGLYSSAVSELKLGADKAPQNPTILYHLGLAYWKNGEKDQAVETLNEALRIEGAFAERQAARKLLDEISDETKKMQ